MKKTYVIVSTLFIVIVAAVLTSITYTEKDVTILQTEINNINNPTTTIDTEITIPKPELVINIDEDNGNMGPGIFDMDLDTKTWTWISTTYSDGKIIKSKNLDKFKLTFKNNEGGKTFSATTDCNGVGGEYIANGKSITFEKMISTLMYCEGSQEAEFSKALSQVSSYHFTDKGELVFDLKYDSGSMVFK